MLKLYHTPLTRSMRVKWVLEELKLSYSEIELPWRQVMRGRHKTPEYLEKHPLGQIPVLEDDGVKIFESVAICQYLVERYGDGHLMPDVGTVQRSEWLQWMYFVPATLEPPLFTAVRHGRLLPKKFQHKHRLDSAIKTLEPIFQLLQTHFSNRRFLLGDDYSLPDLLMVATMLWYMELADEYPMIKEYVCRVCELPSWHKAYEGLGGLNVSAT